MGEIVEGHLSLLATLKYVCPERPANILRGFVHLAAEKMKEGDHSHLPFPLIASAASSMLAHLQDRGMVEGSDGMVHVTERGMRAVELYEADDVKGAMDILLDRHEES